MFSILMPIYNGIEFIHESVSSVLAQTCPDWELLVAINGHAQNSTVFQIAQTYEKADPRIKVFDFFQIRGKSNALNALVPHCSYDHVALLDVDDIWHPAKLQTQAPFLRQYDVVGTHCMLFGDIHGALPDIPLGDISNFNFSLVNPIINSSSVIRKQWCHWNDNHIEDYDLWIRLRKRRCRFYNCPEVLVKHRIHKKSAFNSKGHTELVKELLLHHY